MESVKNESLQESPRPVDSPRLRNLKPYLIPVAIVFSFVAVFLIAYLVFLKTQAKRQLPQEFVPKTQTSTTSTPATPSNETADWKVYTNRLWGYSLKYPSDKLVACNPTDKGGLRLWTAPFDCPVAHDVLYEVAVIWRNAGEYSDYKKPSYEETIVVDGVEAVKKKFVYGLEDGPLAQMGESISILIPRGKGLIEIQFWGNDPENVDTFNKILSTFKFLDSSDIPPELSCNTDSDCGINSCSGCKIMNKNYIKETDKICLIDCGESRPACYGGMCVNKVGENQYKLGIEDK